MFKVIFRVQNQGQTFSRGVSQDQVLVALFDDSDGKLWQSFSVLNRTDVAATAVAVAHAPVDAASLIANWKDRRWGMEGRDL